MDILKFRIVKKILFYFTITAVTVLAFLPNYDNLPAAISFSDLLNHAFAFGVLFVLFKLAHPSFLTKQVLLFLLIYAVWIEAVQSFLPTRYASLSDIVADGVGLFIGYLLLLLFQKISDRKSPSY